MLNEQSNPDHTTTIPYSYAASADVVRNAAGAAAARSTHSSPPPHKSHSHR